MKKSILITVAIAAVLMVGYQNCSQDFDPAAYMGLENSSHDQAPKISTVIPEISIVVGETALLSFSVTGSNLTYSWFKDEVPLDVPGNIPVYQIANAQTVHSGVYKLCVENGFGLKCATVQLVVNEPNGGSGGNNGGGNGGDGMPTATPTPTPAMGKYYTFACEVNSGPIVCGATPPLSLALIEANCTSPIQSIVGVPASCVRGSCVSVRYTFIAGFPGEQYDFTIYFACR